MHSIAGTPRGPEPRAHLYGIKHSHSVLASRMALELTGIPFVAHGHRDRI
jgi:hypothetical protein